jgi:hypothetical protein
MAVFHVALEGSFAADVVVHSAAAAVSCRDRESCAVLRFMCGGRSSDQHACMLSHRALIAQLTQDSVPCVCLCGMYAYATV